MRETAPSHTSRAMRRSLFPLALVIGVAILAAGTASAGLVGQLGVLDPVNANGGINPTTGNPWQEGDQYRLAFYTEDKRNALSGDIADYNTFVQSVAAGSAAFPDLGNGTWKVLGSTATVSARQNTGTDVGDPGAGLPIFVLDGVTMIAQDSADMWNGFPLRFPAATSPNGQNMYFSPYLNEDGVEIIDPPGFAFGREIATGTNSSGNIGSDPLGDPNGLTRLTVGASRANTTGRIWQRFGNRNPNSNWSFYALSDPLSVIDDSGPQSNLIAHYPLDTVIGGTTTPDTTGINGPGILNGGADLSGTPGKIGGAFTFNNSSGNFVGIQDAAFGLDTFTTSVWFQPTSIDSGDPIANWTNAGPSPRTFLIRTSGGALQTYVREDGSAQIGGSAAFPTETLTTADFNHAVITYDGQNLRTYLNGELSTNLYSFPSPRPVGQGVQGTAAIGGRGSSEQNMNGLVDDVAFWNITLPDGHVAALHNLAETPALNYNASLADQLFRVYSGALPEAAIGSLTWTQASGLGGGAGDVVDLGGGRYFLNLDGTAGVSGLTAGPPPLLSLKVDFNSNQNGGGSSTGGDPQDTTANHNQSGWASYHANHEVAAEFTTATYPGGITVTPAWPNTTDNRVMQSLDRNGQNQAGDVTGTQDNTWAATGTLIADAGDLNLVTDWLGIDTRTGSGGNGNWDGGDNGTPTYMTLTLGGLPVGMYSWKSYHHDTENVHTLFQIELSNDGGDTFVNYGQDFYMTDGTDGGNPNSATDGAPWGPQKGWLLTPDPYQADNLPSTVAELLFYANGIDDVVLRFAPLSGTLGNAVHNQLWGINGFELTQISNVPEPTTLSLLGLGALLALRRRRRTR